MLNKKADINILEMLLLVLIYGGLFIFFLIYFNSLSNLSINDKQVKSQIISKKLISSCFSNKYALINEENFNQEKLDKCFFGIDDDSIFRIRIDNQMPIYINSKKNIFEQRGGFCGATKKSSQFCAKNIYPVTLKKTSGEKQLAFLTVESIIS